MTISTILLVILLTGVTVFQILLALGSPYGVAAWGGKHKGVLPVKYRIGSAISALLFLFFISAFLSQSGVIDLYRDSFENIVVWIATVFFGLSVIMNAVSRSTIERLWVPYVAIMFILSLLLVI